MRLDVLKTRPELLRHGLSLLVSLIIHAGLIYFLAVYFVSVKIIDFGKRVTPVLLVPPEKLHLPKIKGNLPNPQDWGAQFPELISRRGRPLKKPEASPAETGAQELSLGMPVDPKLTSGFRLDQTPPEKGQSGPVRSLVFPLSLGAKTAPGSTVFKRSSPKSVNWKQYIYGGLPGARGSSPGVYYGGRSGAASLRGWTAAPPLVKNYNLSPWARGVVELIQKNWTIPSTQAISSEDAVEIAVVILKSGEISSATIVGPSDNKSFDQAALEAVEVSSPLPPLPGDFPAASLEISFVFSRQW